MSQNRVGVIGWPIAHSLSPAMHNAAFAALGMGDWLYELLPVPPDIVRLSLKEFRNHGFIGVNVTVPLKELVMPHVRPDERAQKIGAANTITLRTLEATNTDVEGLMADLSAHGIDVRDQTVLLLGAGGAARAALYGLTQAGAQVTLVNRTPERAENVLHDLDSSAGMLPSYDLLGDYIKERPPALIINTTPVGMWPNIDASPWPEHVPFPRAVTLYDMIYRPERTRLMEQAEAAGGRAINGLGMLVRQGAAAFKIWTGIEPPVDVMFAAALGALRERTT